MKKIYEKQRYYLIFSYLLIIFLGSCQGIDDSFPQKNQYVSIKKEDLSSIPYASTEDLDMYKDNKAIINYKFARKAALLEMNNFIIEFKELYECNNFTLFKQPVLIYGDDNLPKLYEFIVLDDKNMPIATITTFAKKEVIDFTACVLPYIRDYSNANSLKYSSLYPYTDSNLIISKSLSKDKIKDLPEIDNSDEIESFWKKIDSKMNEIVAMNDKDFLEKYSKPATRAIKYYTIPNFDRDNLKRTRFVGAGWCGPTAMAWVYRGFYSYYKNKYIPLHNENSTEHYNIIKDQKYNVSYYLNTCELVSDIGRLCKTEKENITGTLPKDFDKTVEKIFPDYKIDRHEGTLKGAPRRAINRGNPIYMIVFTKKGELHYIIGFGTKDKYKWLGIHTNSWIYVMDNGTNIQYHNYLPYYRNSNFFNFTNKYLIMGEFVKKRQ